MLKKIIAFVYDMQVVTPNDVIPDFLYLNTAIYAF